ncbi:MAG TPA: molybdopterin-dependent oxidoreductase [Xanthobacteraceae bacterium]
MKKLISNHSHWGAFLAEVEDGRFVGVRPFPRDPDPSPMISAMPAAVYSPTRVAQPFVRQGWLHGRGGGARGREPFVPVSWERALDLVAGELLRARHDHGAEAIMGGSQGWGSAGIFHDARTQVRRFLAAAGGFIDQTANYSFGAALTFLPHVLGSAQAVSGPLTSWSSIARHTRLLVLFGGANPKNMQVAKGGCGEHAVGGWMQALARAGVEVINISPIRDDAPQAAGAKWMPIRPNTDTAMMLALAHTLIAEGRHDEAFLSRYCAGFEPVERYVMGATDGQPKDADWASRITGMAPESIRGLARRMAENRTMLSASWSLQRADHGEQPYWALILLACVVGQIGLPGGGFGFGYGSAAGIAEAPLAFGPPATETLANPLARAIPAARIADCLLKPGASYDYNGKPGTYPDIRLVYWAGGNPFHHHQDLNRLRRAWQRPETIIVHEPWWTATARHADIVLPATTTLERNDIGCAHRDRYVIAMQQAIAPVGEARSDFAIFSALAQRLGCEDAYTQGRDEMAWLRHLYGRWRDKLRTTKSASTRVLDNEIAIPDFDEFWAAGFLEIPRRGDEYVLLSAFREDPDKAPLATPSRRIELYSERIAGFGYEDCPPHPTWLEPAEWLGAEEATNFPLHLVSSQPRHRLHSQMDGGPISALGKIAGREAVAINPQDAARRGIGDGDVVRVFNRRGECLAGATLTETVTPGVIRLSCGAWYDPADAGDTPICVHGHANMLTFDRGTSKLGQGPSCATTLVEIERWTKPIPPVRAFIAPPLAERIASSE